jgi:hypothetical protein
MEVRRARKAARHSRDNRAVYFATTPGSPLCEPVSFRESFSHSALLTFRSTEGVEPLPSALSPSYAAFLTVAVERMKASRSALIRSACVVGIPCGNPG